MIPQKDLLKLTGYIRGGCSPFGMKKLYPTFLHVSASEQEFICVSAGIRGAQIKLSPKALVQILQAKQENLIF
jgi:Cys-tRNA(Pro)/Cys-tRNA(Cys) deacylase